MKLTNDHFDLGDLGDVPVLLLLQVVVGVPSFLGTSGSLAKWD